MPTILDDPMIIPIIVGLVGVTLAILERGYKTFLEERKENPQLKFGGAYLLNIIMTAGGVGVIITGIIPAIITELSSGQVSTTITLVTILLQLALGYTVAYRMLDGLNNMTAKKEEVSNPTQ